MDPVSGSPSVRPTTALQRKVCARKECIAISSKASAKVSKKSTKDFASTYFTKSSVADFDGIMLLMRWEDIFLSILATYVTCVSTALGTVPLGPAGFGPAERRSAIGQKLLKGGCSYREEMRGSGTLSTLVSDGSTNA